MSAFVPRPLETARSSSLRGSFSALQRAAQRARQIAMQTGTRVVVVRDGVVLHVDPEHAERTEPITQEPIGTARSRAQ